ncbi:unnamed protein product [Caenorhabditis bovis]|uniref:Methyltransferase domain-containing protein n=1 Tax=Caenorhabditis bovis TaxID=2654633 RepID=A0A8S1ES38_9PELO|nr:unnamed protein product [Caenorhabditis bovis]
MVVIASTIADLAPVNCELQLESGRNIKYVATRNANPKTHVGEELPIMRKNSHHTDWEGVNSLCQAIDQIVEIEMESDFFDGKSVLEIGFSTGLPSVYAFESGANEVALHTFTKTAMEVFCKPTLKRNNIPNNQTKFSFGSLEEMKKCLGGKKFDIILAPDLLNRSETEFELLHDIIDEALSFDGICLFSCSSYYTKVDGSLDAFLSLVKRRREFDAIERWSSPKTDIIQKKVVALIRSVF